MTNRDRILELLRASEHPLTDSEIRRRTGIEPHQQVNQICRALAAQGLIDRTRGPEGRLVNSAVERTGFEENADDAGRCEASAPGEVPELDFEGTLIAIPCSGRKRRGGTEATEGTSVVDGLPEELGMELLQARQRNASSSQLDESLTMPAAERYAGTLYDVAADALERMQEAGQKW
ncbi:MAG: helix-turn-helix domain-containing protein [Gammaproteobacteria bacterium]|nr:helix-turn-helix domain-containing protein [Gammaproteobacteria bacterium]